MSWSHSSHLAGALDARKFEILQFACFVFLFDFRLELLKFHLNSIIDVSSFHVLLSEEAGLSFALFWLVLLLLLLKHSNSLVFLGSLVRGRPDISLVCIFKVALTYTRLHCDILDHYWLFKLDLLLVYVRVIIWKWKPFKLFHDLTKLKLPRAGINNWLMSLSDERILQAMPFGSITLCETQGWGRVVHHCQVLSGFVIFGSVRLMGLALFVLFVLSTIVVLGICLQSVEHTCRCLVRHNSAPTHYVVSIHYSTGAWSTTLRPTFLQETPAPHMLRVLLERFV